MSDESSHQWKSCQSSHASHAARVNCQTRRVWRSSRCQGHASKVRSKWCGCGQRDALMTQPLEPCSVTLTNLSIFSLVIWCDQQSCVSVWLMRPLPASERCPASKTMLLSRGSVGARRVCASLCGVTVSGQELGQALQRKLPRRCMFQESILFSLRCTRDFCSRRCCGGRIA